MDDGLRTATPEELGLTRAPLERMTEAIRGGEEYRNIHSVIVVKDGRLVYEEYFAGEDEHGRLGRLGHVTFDRDTRPDLFEVAIAEVPIVDMLRFDLGRHRAQMGTATDPRQFAFLHASAPLQHVRPGTCYPAMLITTNLNDERAPAWQALKFGAALQRAQACDRPILLRVNDRGGHGDAAFWAETMIERMAFAMRRLGMAEQPRN